MAAIPPTGRTVRVLVGPPSVKTPTDLQNMASGVTGTFHPDSDTSITIQHATLNAQAGGLQLVITGTLFSDVQWPLPNVDATFDYTVMLHLHPGLSITDPNQVMTVSAPLATDFSARNSVMRTISPKNPAAANVSHIGNVGERQM